VIRSIYGQLNLIPKQPLCKLNLIHQLDQTKPTVELMTNWRNQIDWQSTKFKRRYSLFRRTKY